MKSRLLTARDDRRWREPLDRPFSFSAIFQKLLVKSTLCLGAIKKRRLLPSRRPKAPEHQITLYFSLSLLRNRRYYCSYRTGNVLTHNRSRLIRHIQQTQMFYFFELEFVDALCQRTRCARFISVSRCSTGYLLEGLLSSLPGNSHGSINGIVLTLLYPKFLLNTPKGHVLPLKIKSFLGNELES